MKESTYTIKVDGKYALVKWTDPTFSPTIDLTHLHIGIVLVGDMAYTVEKWIKCYKDRKLIWVHKVPKEWQESVKMGSCCR